MATQPAITYNEAYYNGGNPAGYSLYSENTYFSETASQLASKFIEKAAAGQIDLSAKRVLVIGCAYGFSVKYLRAQGVTAIGMDISSYAISQAPAEVAPFVFVGDCRLAAAYASAKSLLGMRANEKFDLIITEDMLSCLSNADAQAAVTLMRKNAMVVQHLLEINPTLNEWYNFHTIAEWKTILGGSDRYYSRFEWSEA